MIEPTVYNNVTSFIIQQLGQDHVKIDDSTQHIRLRCRCDSDCKYTPENIRTLLGLSGVPSILLGWEPFDELISPPVAGSYDTHHVRTKGNKKEWHCESKCIETGCTHAL